MWISKHMASYDQPEESLAQLGSVTISGKPLGVFLHGERRNVVQVEPLGYHYKPKAKDAVLAIFCQKEEEFCIVGTEQTSDRELKDGEVWISVSPTSGIHLKADGAIDLVGNILLNGEPLKNGGDTP